MVLTRGLNRRLRLILNLAVTALGLSIPMAARPAQSLVVINGTPLLDGACEFQPGQKGSFEISSGQAGVKATVTVSSDGGRIATYTPAGGKGGPLKIGDVKPDGACRVSRQDKICAWLPARGLLLPRPARLQRQQRHPEANWCVRTSIVGIFPNPAIGNWRDSRATRLANSNCFARPLATSALGGDALIGHILVEIDSAESDGKTAILENARFVMKNHAEAAKCQVRPDRGNSLAPDALVVDVSAEESAADKNLLRNACGPMGLKEGSQQFWCAFGGFAWFFNLGHEELEFDPVSLTLVRKDERARGFGHPSP